MQTMSFTARTAQTGRWRSTEFVGTFFPLNILVSALSTESTNKKGPNALHRDAFTTTSDFIISPHSGAQGLYIATCGSFHGYKFFPVLGKYVTQMLEGNLEHELKEKWSWDRERPDPKDNPDWPRWEMKDLMDVQAKL
jgi:hypothetical protein